MTRPLFGPPEPLFSRATAVALILGLIVAYAISYAFSAAHTDTADEIWKAVGIRNGSAYPLQGPPLGGVLHLGPFWFYLTAIPLWIHSSWLSVALFIGLICSMKFPLAYYCGRRLWDHDFGVLWAACLFLPGWPNYEQLIFLNPNGVAAAGLAVLALYLRSAGSPTPARAAAFFFLGLCYSLAIHVHPTSAPFGLLIAWLLWVQRRQGRPLTSIGALMAGGIVPLLPYFVSQAVNGFADWRSASTYVAEQVSLANVVNAPAVVANYLMTGPAVVAEYILEWNAPAAFALGVAVASLCAASFIGLLLPPRDGNARIRTIQFLIAFLALGSWVAILRPTTPVQFTWVLAVPAGALAAAGLHSIGRAKPFRALAYGLAIAVLAVNLHVMFSLARLVELGRGTMPYRILDIKGGLPPIVFHDVWFPAWAHEPLGRKLCSVKGSLSLHGHLAAIVDVSLGLQPLMECEDRSRIRLSGSEATHRLFGMTRAFWQTIGASPSCWIGSLGIIEAITPFPAATGIEIADGSVYLPRKPSGGQLQSISLEATGPGAMMVTNMLGRYERFRMVSAQANGQAVEPSSQDDLSYLFEAPKPLGPVKWTLTIETTNPSGVDAVLFDTAAEGRRGIPPRC